MLYKNLKILINIFEIVFFFSYNHIEYSVHTESPDPQWEKIEESQNV